MNGLHSNLPLQDMIAGVLSSATEKLAAEQTTTATTHQTTTAKSGKTRKTTGKTTTEKTAELTDPDYIEKLAESVDIIADHAASMFAQPKSLLQTVLEKQAAADSIGAGRGATSLPTNEAGTSGRQKYKKDKPATEDASESETNAGATTGGLPAGSTQMPNNMGAAPGQDSGAVPRAAYPAKGPLVNLGKHASIRELYMAAMQKEAYTESRGFESGKGSTPMPNPSKEPPALPGESPAAAAKVEEKLKGMAKAKDLARRAVEYPFQGGAKGVQAGEHWGHGVGRWGARAGIPLAVGALAAKAMSGGSKEKRASDYAREIIMQKLAGEDVMKANVDGGGHSNPLAGMGQLTTTQAGQSSPHQPGDPTGGFGNQGRSHIQSITAAINMTKRDAKGPQKTQLKEVLTEPALSAKHDSKLHENLRNTGKAGVKIAAARAYLQKIAEEGCTCGDKGECKYCHMKSAISSGKSTATTGTTKTAQMGMPGGAPGAMAAAGEGADGCSCGNAGECRICKLKAALAAAHQGQSQGQAPMQPDTNVPPGAAKDM